MNSVKKGTEPRNKDVGRVEKDIAGLSLEEQKAGASAKKKASKDAITLEITLFDRLLKLHGDDIKRMLTTQYRMHEAIMSFPSEAMYGGHLAAAEAVRTRLLKDLPYEVNEVENTTEPLVFYDTQGGDFVEKTEDEDNAKGKSSVLAESKVNEAEALIVRDHVSSLVTAGVKAEDIAVITPYNGQLAMLSSMLKERFHGLELGSIDGFQGEYISLVCSWCSCDGLRPNRQRERGCSGQSRPQ